MQTELLRCCALLLCALRVRVIAVRRWGWACCMCSSGWPLAAGVVRCAVRCAARFGRCGSAAEALLFFCSHISLSRRHLHT
jgi:hypothetical protein